MTRLAITRKTASLRSGRRRQGWLGGLLLLGALLTGLPGCATYSERLARAREAVDRGRPQEALDELNAVLGVESRDELPEEFGSSTALGLLERGSLLQMSGDPEAS
ncbi:MAG: hypothetical protein ACX98W_08770, partial [bacterium]